MGTSSSASGFTFRVELDGVAVAGFTEASGLSTDADAVGYRDGASRTIRGLPGLRTSAGVTLKRGLSAGPALLSWYRAGVAGTADARTLSIVLVDEQRRDVRRWRVDGARIAKVESADLSGTGNEVAIESLELTHEGVTLEG
jgi:phage tail-like protein